MKIGKETIAWVKGYDGKKGYNMKMLYDENGEPLVKGGCGHSEEQVLFSAYVVAVCCPLLGIVFAAIGLVRLWQLVLGK